MASEIAQAPEVFSNCVLSSSAHELTHCHPDTVRSFYTIARGSSDAVATILSYEYMRWLGVPMTSLPPSVFSIGTGVNMKDTVTLVISQSGSSNDLVQSTRGAQEQGSTVIAITNHAESAIVPLANATLTIGAGEERAVPATKTVIGSIATGMALLGTIIPDYRLEAEKTARVIAEVSDHPNKNEIRAAILQASHIYVVGRDTGFGAAQEIALKLKECCAIHAEAYSASEVLHGPLQLATKPLLVIMLDTEQEIVRESLDIAESKFRSILHETNSVLIRMRPSDVGIASCVPATAASVLIYMLYSLILEVACTLGFDPDHPRTLSKVTQTL